MSDRRHQTPRRVDEPSPGFFRIRLVRGGPWVAAEIRLDAEMRWLALIDGIASDVGHPDAALAADVFRVWHYGDPITDAEHAFLVATAAWARIHAPDRPEANPTRPINVGREPPAF